jgi:hypothetical protein
LACWRTFGHLLNSYLSTLDRIYWTGSRTVATHLPTQDSVTHTQTVEHPASSGVPTHDLCSRAARTHGSDGAVTVIDWEWVRHFTGITWLYWRG